MNDIKFHYQKTGIPVSPPAVILTYEKYKKLHSLLKELLAMAKYYKPVPDEYMSMEDQDEETWCIGELYSRVEKELGENT